MKGKKTGGRQKGSLNKTTTVGKSIITGLLSEYSESGMMHNDFLMLEPKDRMAIAEKFMQYVMPKMQATSVDMNVQNQGGTLEEMLKRISEEE